MITCTHCRLEYQVHVQGQDPTTEYQAMEGLSKVRDLRMKFDDNAIEMRQKKGGHSCQRTFLKGHIYWERCNVPKGQTIGNRFLHIEINIQLGTPASTVSFESTAADAEENARGLEQAKAYPLARLPDNISKLRLLLGDLEQYWTLTPGVPLGITMEVRGSQIKRIITRVSSVKPASPAAQKLDSDFQYRKEEAKVKKNLPSGLESSQIEVYHVLGRGNTFRGEKPTYDPDKIDESLSGPSPTPAAAAAPMPEAEFAPKNPIAYKNPSTYTRRNDIAGSATNQLKAWARQQGLTRQDKGLEAQIGLPAERPRPEESEIAGNGSGKDSKEEERAELELQLVRLEQTRKERQRQLWDRFKIDEYNVETSKVDQEYYQQKTDLQQQFLERRRRRV
ncbi:MAG: hypothetical protein OHK93_007230 [Ramalina farinacea]|uniref:Uncharacterized protein n=1 Tax=Ramalina farinacea TaxID=258253 RepID=A0AA43QK29_9LECA|nr:hypothetical protein [Ramalina farinacea]